MQDKMFLEWLQNRMQKNSARDCVSRCRRVEKALSTDLDKEYRRDRGEHLLGILSVSGMSDKTKKEMMKKFNFNSEKYFRQGISALKSSVHNYYVFIDKRKIKV